LAVRDGGLSGSDVGVVEEFDPGAGYVGDWMVSLVIIQVLGQHSLSFCATISEAARVEDLAGAGKAS